MGGPLVGLTRMENGEGIMQFLPVTGCCLLVGALERSVKFYTEQVGLELMRKAPGFGQYRPRNGVHLSNWEIDHFCAETGLPHHGKARVNKAMVGMQVDSRDAVDQAYRELGARGVVFAGPPRLHAWNCYAAYFDDPDGNIWEIYWWAAGGPQTADLPIRPQG